MSRSTDQIEPTKENTTMQTTWIITEKNATRHRTTLVLAQTEWYLATLAEGEDEDDPNPKYDINDAAPSTENAEFDVPQTGTLTLECDPAEVRHLEPGDHFVMDLTPARLWSKAPADA